MTAPLATQVDAANAATTREQRAAEIRNRDVRRVVDYLALPGGSSGPVALGLMLRSVEEQAYLLTGVRFDLGVGR